MAFVALTFVVVPQPAAADGFDTQRFHPMPDQTVNFFSTASAEVPEHLDWTASLMLNYGHNPVVWRNEQGERIDRLVGHQAVSHLLLSAGLVDWFEVGLDIPLIVSQSGSKVSGIGFKTDQAGFGIGDIHFVPKAQIFNTRRETGGNGMALSVLLDLYLPSGNSDRLQGGDFRAGPRIALDAVVEEIHFGANLGYRYRSAAQIGNAEVRDTLGWNVAAAIPVTDDFRATGEVFGRLTPAAEQTRRRESPTEFLLGGKYRHDDLFFSAGAGAGLVNGYGTPDWRMFASVGWSPFEAEPPPTPQPEPQCRAETIDTDCASAPDPVCKEGVLETFAVACEDGDCAFPSTERPCPEGTHCGQRDGVADCVPIPECTVDADCTDEPHAHCEDGVLTTYTGVCTAEECHYEPQETFCPDDHECGLKDGRPGCVPEPERVEVDEEEERIEIDDVIHFAVDSADIEERSHSLLDEIAHVLRTNDHLELVRIEGHTDDTGARQYNLDLSERRAEAVRSYLIDAGIDPDRLVAAGKGPDEPIADNDTPAGREQNRRVEFHIEQRD